MTATKSTLIDPLMTWAGTVDRADIIGGPADFLAAWGALCRAIGQLIDTGERGRAPGVLTALAACEFILAEHPDWAQDTGIAPVQPLPAAWLGLVDDGSPEFRLAAALAGLRPVGGHGGTPPEHIQPFRAHLEAVSHRSRSAGEPAVVDWDFGAHRRQVVWENECAVDGINAVFSRRIKLWEGPAEGFLTTARPACPGDIGAFLRADTDEHALSRYAFELSLIDLWDADTHAGVNAPDNPDWPERDQPEPDCPDPAWSLMARCYSGEAALNRDIHRLAERGDLDSAIEFGRAHLRDHGRPDAPADVSTDVDSRRLAAALIWTKSVS